MKPSVQKVRDSAFVAHEDESGAVALLCLAAVLALMMVAWMIFDAHKATKDKIMLQGAADTAAFSHAAVEARSMNMIAYGNIAKRSVVDIHAMYSGMYLAYAAWIAMRASQCNIYNWSACWDAFINGMVILYESLDDQANYSGTPFLVLADGGNTTDAHLRDVTAIDNYQHYMHHITPWWGFAEQLSRGWRNGATTVVSFPPPPGQITVGLSAVQHVIDGINQLLSAFGMTTINMNAYHGNDNLPIAKTDYGMLDWADHVVSPTAHPEAFAEHMANALIHKDRSDEDADNGWVFGMGLVLSATVGMANADSAMSPAVDPWELDTGGSEAMWLKRTSNLTFAYLNDTDKMDVDNEKYDILPTDYNHGLGIIDEQMYQASGTWTMSKSEITFIGDGWYGDTPDMWHPSWTARMRPVHLPGEFQDANFTMFDAYTQVVPYLALSAQVGSIQGGNSLNAFTSSIRDIVRLGLSSAAMGPSTASGIAK